MMLDIFCALAEWHLWKLESPQPCDDAHFICDLQLLSGTLVRSLENAMHGIEECHVYYVCVMFRAT